MGKTMLFHNHLSAAAAAFNESAAGRAAIFFLRMLAHALVVVARVLGFSALALCELVRLAVRHWEFPSTVLWFFFMVQAAKAGLTVNGVWLLPIFFILFGRAMHDRIHRRKRR